MNYVIISYQANQQSSVFSPSESHLGYRVGTQALANTVTTKSIRKHVAGTYLLFLEASHSQYSALHCLGSAR